MKTKTLTHTALMTALICILAPISLPIPFSPVSLTLATFSFYITAYVLKPKYAVAATGLYLLIGAIGLPVFSGYGGGISRFASASGGYLIGFLFLTGISSFAIHKYPNKPIMQLLGMFIGSLAMYLIGTVWLSYVTNASFFASLPSAVFVFLPFDIFKLVMAYIVMSQDVCKRIWNAN